MDNQQISNVVALAGVLVLIFNHFGIRASQQDVAGILGAVATIVGIISNWFITKNANNLTTFGFPKK